MSAKTSKSKPQSPAKETTEKVKKESSTKENCLYNVLDYNPKNLIFSDLVEGKVKTDPKINFWRILLSTKNVEFDEDNNPTKKLSGTVGDVYLSFPEMFCFGVQEAKAQDEENEDKKKKKDDAFAGHSCSFVLQDKEGPTEQQKEVTDKIKEIIAAVKAHILTLEGKIGRDEDELRVGVRDLDKLIYQKRDKATKKVAADAGPPSINPKLIEFGNKGGGEPVIQTTFYLVDETTNERTEIPALDLLSNATQKKYFRGTPIIKLESVFINAKTISIQWRVSECDVKLAQSGPTKFRQYSAKKQIASTTEDKLVQDFSAKATIKKKTEVKPSSDNEEEPEADPDDLTLDDPEAPEQAPEADPEEAEAEAEPEPVKPKKKIKKVKSKE